MAGRFKVKKIIFWVLFIGLGIFVYVRYYWVFETGTKGGILNTFGKKGYVWKTYEGKLIQSGFRTNVQSNEFEFSVESESVAKVLLENAGMNVQVHFKSYLGALPWRGWQKYIVDSVYEVRNPTNLENVISPQ